MTKRRAFVLSACGMACVTTALAPALTLFEFVLLALGLGLMVLGSFSATGASALPPKQP